MLGLMLLSKSERDTIAYLGDNKQRVALLIFEIQRATDSDFPMVIAYRKVVGLWTT